MFSDLSHEQSLGESHSTHVPTAQESVPWGDYCRTSAQVHEEGIFRVLCHNVNGFSAANDHCDVRNFAMALSDKEISVFGIQEPNRNFERPWVLESLHSAIRGVSTHHHGAVSSARLDWTHDYQPGGTAVSVRDKWATRFLAKGSDDIGRWSWITLTGRGTTKITFISGYRVCDGANQAQITSRTVRAQQEWIYAHRGYKSINLREQFVRDLIVLVNDFQAQGHDIVLMADLNESSGHGSAVDRLCFGCNLVDAHTLSSDLSAPPPTHFRGSQKIDFVLVSPSLSASIVGVSILALHDGYASDHRALIVDFDATSLFSGPTSNVVTPVTRRLTSTNPKAVHVYVHTFLQYIAKHQLWQKVSKLHQRSESGQWTASDIEEWEKLDNLLVSGRLAAEKQCPRKNSGKYPWSPELARAGKMLLYWKMRLCALSSGILNSSMLMQLQQTLAISESDVALKSGQALRQKYRKARRSLTNVQAQAASLREDYLHEAAKLQSDLHGMSLDAACRAIAQREKSSKQFRQLRTIFNQSKSSGLDRIDVPDSYAVLREGEATPRIPLVTKEEIEEVLVPHTERRFRQHHETPFGTGERKARLGKDCLSDDAQNILNGSYDWELDKLSEEAREWLRQLQRKDFVTSGALISTQITAEDWISGWSKMRESTASAPGGHYGHYKTSAVAARLPEDHDDFTTTLAELYAMMTTMPLKHGFAPRRWQRCIDAILEKIPGKPLLEKLRIIMLYEADFNFVLKLIWGKRLVRHAEKYKVLGTSNHGSRPGRQTKDAHMEKVLLYEYARLTHTSLITMDNDAKSCYDRIIKTLAMLACIGVGLPVMAAAMHNRTHHGMQHQIKSRHGLFRSYSGSDDDELEGTGQGSGASPAIWLIYSVSLLAAYAKFSEGMKMFSPYDDMSVLIRAIFYVDDGMPGVSDSGEKYAVPLPRLIGKSGRAAQAWERLLYGSGGALELSKCFTYIIYWDLSGGEHRLISPQEIPNCQEIDGQFFGPLALTYGNLPFLHKIATESPWIGRRTLGIRIAPAGNWTDEFTYRRLQSRELALKIAGSSMNSETARVAYFSTVCPKIEFPLGATQFTQKECDAISSPVLRACLSKMSYNCNMPKEVVYGPPSLFGLGMHDYYIEQGIQQISTLVGHFREDSETGKMMRIELQLCQVQAGTASHLLADPIDPIDYIETCWIMSIRDFLRTYGLRIDITSSVIPELQCDGDEFIMDALRLRGDCTSIELIRINACRMYLQVARISEIASADGSLLRDDVLKGKDNDIYLSRASWPRMGRPPKLWWNLWKRKLKLVFSIDGVAPVLRRKLGNWNSQMKPTEWSTLASTRLTAAEVYLRRDDGYYSVHRASSANSNKPCVQMNDSEIIDMVPACAAPASLGLKRKDGTRRVYVRGLSIPPAQNSKFSSFAEYVAGQPSHIATLLEHSDLSDETAHAVSVQIRDKTNLYCGTDGGLLDGAGSFGFIWGNSETGRMSGAGRGVVPGPEIGMSSTRTELCGIFAALSYLKLVKQYYDINDAQEQFQCTFVCDSKAALQRVTQLDYTGFGTTWRCRANYDLEAAIRDCIEQNFVPVRWQWVRGHASRRKKPHDFTWEETLNEAADGLATDARKLPGEEKMAHWPEQRISVEGPRGRITGRLATEIRYCCTAPDLESYWSTRFNWTKRQVKLIDTIGTEAVASKMRPASQSRIQKLRCGWLPVNSRESRSDPDRLSGCSACSTTDLVPETVDHLFQCTHMARRRAILERFQSFHAYFRELKTSTPLLLAIKAGTMAWIEGRDPPAVATLALPNTEHGRLVALAYKEQTGLGWNVLFRGFWTTTWRRAQEMEFQRLTCRERHENGERWAGRAQLWFFDLFEFIWGLRNADEHGTDAEAQRLIRRTKCERTIRRLYASGAQLPLDEQHPFRETVEDLLFKPLSDQELWITKTEAYLPKAYKRARERPLGQPSIKQFFARLPR